MDDNDNVLFLDAMDHIVFDALAAIGDDPRARFELSKRLLAVVREVNESGPSFARATGNPGKGVGNRCVPGCS